MPKRTRLKRGSSRPQKIRLKRYTEKQLDGIYKKNSVEAKSYANDIVDEIKKRVSSGDPVIQLTYGQVPAFRNLEWLEKLYQDIALERDFSYLYDEFVHEVEDIVHKKTGWVFLGDPGDGTVVYAVSPKHLKKLEKEGWF